MKGIAGMNTMKMTTGGGGGGGGGGGKMSLKKYASVLLTYHFPLNFEATLPISSLSY